jgi:hypothetical protein|eukprot:CAMPEP_0179448524 /NCGR_PEP_ID=MMETSP0799-20121207/32343_1 /TAXON_ID=46947 /ORGANISM="Geminigera cryophila, Strain CCMP2564" /LENGTH=111 /DNA_ID=CAMNT_0021240399 /DNA_START=935 /DNA_END=1270 /DNA_ORIENTATION=+
MVPVIPTKGLLVENVPAAHKEQTVLLAPANPGLHVQSVILVLPGGDSACGGHAMHAASDNEPARPLYVPAGQIAQCDAADELVKVPAEQSWHFLTPRACVSDNVVDTSHPA